VPVRDGEVRKRVLVVSRDSINEAGMDVLAARVTSQDKFRRIPSVVEVEPSEDNGLTETSFVLCHAVVELAQDNLDARPFGQLSVGHMLESDKKLIYAFDLDRYVRNDEDEESREEPAT
jgi:mRNA-degrading endonuclease toxin of MazEF toxin-antitoxin module